MGNCRSEGRPRCDEFCDAIHAIVATLKRYDAPYRPADLPRDGIYFFYEAGELRRNGEPRIVRVGTHKKPGGLPRRLRDHYRGNRRGSVFRWHLGRAILRARGADEPERQLWEKKGAPMPSVEQEVTERLRRDFFFRCLPVAGKEERLELEAWLIATLAACEGCRPSPGWLGLWSPEELIPRSGLWNYKHVDARFDPRASARLLALVQRYAELGVQ